MMLLSMNKTEWHQVMLTAGIFYMLKFGASNEKESHDTETVEHVLTDISRLNDNGIVTASLRTYSLSPIEIQYEYIRETEKKIERETNKRFCSSDLLLIVFPFSIQFS